MSRTSDAISATAVESRKSRPARNSVRSRGTERFRRNPERGWYPVNGLL
jgi:hypothetical protein